MNNILNIKKIHSDFCSWRVADAHVVGGKNTNNGGLRLVPKLNTNKGTKRYILIFVVGELLTLMLLVEKTPTTAG